MAQVTITHPDIADQIVDSEHAERMIARDGRFKIKRSRGRKTEEDAIDVTSDKGTAKVAPKSGSDSDCGCT